MPLFGEDPKDLLIQSQKEEIQYLRAKVDELQRELLAMTSTSAYRLVHKSGEEPPAPPPTPTPMQMRGAEPYKPELTEAQIKAEWGDS
jgi:hypothetical protein